MFPSLSVVFGRFLPFSNQRFPNQQQAASVQILRGSGSSLVLANQDQVSFVFATHESSFPIVGIAGVAIGDVYPDLSGPEVVVTTIDGYLYVFQVSILGFYGDPFFRLDLVSSIAQVGALGAHNSIHIGDHAMNGTLDAGQDGRVEIYVAGSMGIRRFDVPHQP